MSGNLRIKVHKAEGFSNEQLQKYFKAVELTQVILNSEEFYKELMKLKLTNTKGMSNQQIYDKMMSGAEDLEPIPDNEADVFITMYYKNNRVVGYTYPSTRETWVNSKFFNSYDPADIGCNLVHEWLHKLGFGHESASEHTSVPYAVGYLVEKLIREYLSQPVPKPVPVPAPEPKPEPSQPEPKPETPAPEPEKVWVCRRVWWKLWLGKVCSWESIK